MPRPKPTVPVDQPIYGRATKGERAALRRVLAALTERRIAADPTAGPLDLVGWLRASIRRDAEELGIPIVEPGSAQDAPGAIARPKARARRA